MTHPHCVHKENVYKIPTSTRIDTAFKRRHNLMLQAIFAQTF